MTDRERIAELIETRWWYIAARSEVAKKMMPTPKHHKNLLGNKKDWLDAVMEVIEQLGYTRQPEPPGLASISETNDVPAPIPEAKKKAGTEPSPDRVEAVIKKLVDLCPFVDECNKQCTPADQANCWELHAREILKLFPVPELTRISNTAIMAILRCAFTVSIPQGAFDAVTSAIEAQLAQDQNTLNKEAGK